MTPAWRDHLAAGADERPWPCCLACVPLCRAGCGDRSTVLRRRGDVVGAFCSGCYGELAEGRIPTARPRIPRRPRGPRLRELQDAARAAPVDTLSKARKARR